MGQIKKALITGITGQDGSYLAEFLIKKNYQVYGIVRRVALEDETHRLWRIKHLLKKIKLSSASLESYASIVKIIQKIKPNEVYHLGAQSYVSYSFEDEFSTLNTNINGTHYLLSAIKEFSPKTKFYFAGSSEMFGKVYKKKQNETTKLQGFILDHRMEFQRLLDLNLRGIIEKHIICLHVLESYLIMSHREEDLNL